MKLVGIQMNLGSIILNKVPPKKSKVKNCMLSFHLSILVCNVYMYNYNGYKSVCSPKNLVDQMGVK